MSDSAISWRQVGLRKTGGRLHKSNQGPTHRSAAPAIPTRFVTTLDREKLTRKPGGGFSTQEERFHSGTTTNRANPPPNAYNAPRSLLKSTPSLSKKGLGNGFVSKSRRDTFAGNGHRGLGPGSYRAEVAFEKITRGSGMGGSVFGRDRAPRTDPGSLSARGRDAPPPTAYNPQDNYATGATPRYGASHPDPSFASTTDRDLVSKSARDVPGPASYNIEGATTAVYHTPSGASSAFKGGPRAVSAGRSRKKRPLGSESIPEVIMSIAPKAKGVVGLGASDPMSAKDTPGPGAYDVVERPGQKGVRRVSSPGDSGRAAGRRHSLRPPVSSLRSAGMLLGNSQQHSQQQQRGDKYAGDVPGPGEYDVGGGMAQESARRRGAGAAFKLPTAPPGAGRNAKNAKNAKNAGNAGNAREASLGPGSYRPRPVGRKSFHLNARSTWV